MRLTRRNIYILPTPAGLLYALMMLAMLIASINYGLPLGYLLTFLMTGVGLVSMLHTFRNLSALELRAGHREPVFAGAMAELQITLTECRGVARHALAVQAHPPAHQGGAQPVDWVDVGAREIQAARVLWPAPVRGRLPLPRIRLSTRHPIGLWRAWTLWLPAGDLIVYPAPEEPAPALPESIEGDGGALVGGPGQEDLAALRAYSPGDPLPRIAWRAVARQPTGELLVRQFEGSSASEQVLSWARLPGGMDAESRLSRLSAWVIAADAAGLRWGLSLPGLSLPVDGGSLHRDRCLEALALADV